MDEKREVTVMETVNGNVVRISSMADYVTSEFREVVERSQREKEERKKKGLAYLDEPIEVGLTNAYHALRQSILARDGWACVACGGTDKLEVHHLMKKTTTTEEFRSNRLALITFCRDCHIKAEKGSLGVAVRRYIQQLWQSSDGRQSNER